MLKKHEALLTNLATKIPAEGSWLVVLGQQRKRTVCVSINFMLLKILRHQSPVSSEILSKVFYGIQFKAPKIFPNPKPFRNSLL